MGITAYNDMFKEHSYNFRNALVCASYKGLHIFPTTEVVELFLRNVILGENYELRNRDLVGATLPQSRAQSFNTEVSKSQIEILDCAFWRERMCRT